MELENEKCVHHWIIGAIENGVSVGVCKKCKAVKEFIATYQTNSNWRNYPKKKKNEK